MKKRIPAILLIIVISALIRIICIGDIEHYLLSIPMDKAWGIWGWGQGNQLNFKFIPSDTYPYPSLSYYVYFIGQALFYSTGKLTGFFNSPDDFYFLLQSNKPLYNSIGVGIALLIGLVSIVVFILLFRKILTYRQLLISSVFFALNILHIEESTAISLNGLLTLWVLVSFYYLIRIYEKITLKNCLFFGLFVGLGASTKFVPFILFSLPVFFLLIRQPLRFPEKRSIFSIAIGGIAAVAIFFLINPYIITDYHAYMNSIINTQNRMSQGHFGYSNAISLPEIWFRSLPLNLNMVVYIGFLLGLIFSIKSKNRLAVPTISLILLYSSYIGIHKWFENIYLLPIYPAIFIMAAIGFEGLFQLPMSRILKKALIICFGTLFIVLSIFNIIRLYETNSKIHSSILLEKWVKEHITPKELTVMEQFPFEFKPEASYSIVYLFFNSTNPEAFSGLYDLSLYDGIEYIIINNGMMDRFKKDTVLFSNQNRFYQELSQKAKLIKSINESGKTPGPRFYIYSLNDTRIQQPPEPQKRDKILSDFYLALAVKCKNSGHREQAAYYAQKAGSYFPENPAIAVQFPEIRTNGLTSVIQYYKNQLVSKPNSIGVVLKLAQLYAHQNQIDSALRYYKTAAQINSGLYTTYYEISLIYFDRLNDIESALNYANKAQVLNPDYSGTNDILGDIYFRKQDYKKALEYYQKTIKIDPEFSFILYKIGLVYEMLNQYGQAAIYFQKYLDQSGSADKRLAEIAIEKLSKMKKNH